MTRPLAIACPSCGAAPGDPCLTERGIPLLSHGARVRAARGDVTPRENRPTITPEPNRPTEELDR